MTACERDRRCGISPENESLDNCVQNCIPPIEKNRMMCEALFNLQRCVGLLSCEHYTQYSAIIDQTDIELARKASYPCKGENVVYIDDCLLK